MEGIWTKSGKGFCAEMSTLEGNGMATGGMIKLPDGKLKSLREFETNRDKENDITDWKAYFHGVKYVIFND